MVDEEDIPSVEITMDEEHLNPGPSEYTYVHLSDFDPDMDRSFGEQVHCYVFESDDMMDELMETIRSERDGFRFSQGVVFPDEAREEVSDADTERMRALEWAVAVLPYMDEYTSEDISTVADSAERYFGFE